MARAFNYGKRVPKRGVRLHTMIDGVEACLRRFDEIFLEKVGSYALTPELRIILKARENGSLSVKNAFSYSGVSYRGFYAVLTRLENANLIKRSEGRRDRRFRNIERI